MFVDQVAIYVKGGDGGNGCVSFRKEKYVPKGGPNGGDGGNGGSVIIRAVEGLTNLAHLSQHRHWKADRGRHGMGSDCHGRSGPDVVIDVPAGTTVRDRAQGHLLRDLRRPGDSLVVAHGGKGGHGNTHFKSSTNRAPRKCERGTSGEDRWIVLELKVIADVGLIGLPNAGKSTLLSRISRPVPRSPTTPSPPSTRTSAWSMPATTLSWSRTSRGSSRGARRPRPRSRVLEARRANPFARSPDRIGPPRRV